MSVSLSINNLFQRASLFSESARILSVLALLVIASLINIPLSAQIGGTGSIQGVVSDSTGAVIPGATVVAKNVATSVTTTRQTTDAGFFVLSPLPAGEYSVTITAGGFQTLVQEHLIVDALSSLGFNATLKIGTAVEQVTVTGAPPALNTVDASMTYTMRNDLYQALPLAIGVGGSSGNIGRDPLQFLTLLPGVTGFTGQSAGTVMGIPSSGSAHAQEVYVEGMPLTNPVLQGETRYLQEGMSLEAVEQFQLVTAGAPVQYTGQGATNFVLKSGTNELHGSVYEYFRNTDLDARTFFSAQRPQEEQNEFGVAIGGPIKKNKIFFYGTYNGFVKRTYSVPSLFSLPTLAERTGNFSGVPTPIYDPQTTNCSGGPCIRQQFAGNIIPTSRLSPISNYLQGPLPTPRNDNLTSNYLSTNPLNFNLNATTDKVDWNISDKHRFYIMYSHGQKSNVLPGPYSLTTLPYPYGDGRGINEIPTMAQVKYTWMASPNLLNQIGYSFSRLWVPIVNVTIDGDWMNKAGAVGLPAGEAASAFPVISWTGPNVPTNWRGSNSPAFNQAMNTFSLLDNLEWTHGKHSVTLGGQIQWLQENVTNQTYGSTASWAFSNNQTAGFGPTGTLLTSTGNAYASYLLGAISTNSITDAAVSEVGPRFRTYNLWVQDTYKITPRLTLTLGLRWDVNTPWRDVQNHLSWLNPTTPNPAVGGFSGALEFAGYGPNSCQCQNNIADYYRGFGPRGGIAYTLDSKTVLRAGYMMTYTRQGGSGGIGSSTGTGLLGYVANVAYNSPDTYSPAYDWDNGVPPYQKAPFFSQSLNTGFNTATGAQAGSITWGNPQYSAHPPRFQNWNFSIQRAITETLTLDVSYVGSNAHYLSSSPLGLNGPALGIWSDQINPMYLALGNLLNASATPANVAAARSMFPGISLPYPNFVGTISQMLRPFPQYSNISVPWGQGGNTNYNSLQIVGRKTFSHGLIVQGNFTWAKALTNMMYTGGQQSGYISQKAQTTDPAAAMNLVASYELPFGEGHRIAGNNAILRAIASDWQLSGVFTYRSGTAFGLIGANCNLPNAGSCYANFNPNFSGPVRINGDYGNGNLLSSTPPVFLDKNAFVSPAPYTYGNTPPVLAYGLRNPSIWNPNISLRREFKITERWRFRLQTDAINIFNHPLFGGPNINTTSPGFGQVTSQSNGARVVQFNARVIF